MKKVTKRLFTLILVLVCTLSIGMTAFATEAQATEINGAADCRLTFKLTDKTNGIFIDEIKITLLNLDTNVEYSYSMSSADYLFGITVGGNVKQGNYSIALSYPSKGQFVINNADGTEIKQFTANSADYTFDWVVASSESGSSNTGKTSGTSDNATTTQTSETANNYVASTSNADADKAWNTFMKSVADIETNSKYSAILNLYKNSSAVYAKDYAKVCSGKADDYLKYSTFEQFLWYSTYVVPLMATQYSDYETYFESVDKWNANVVGNTYSLLKNQGATDQAEAYKTLMEWQYNYFIKNGAMYNFITGKTSIEDNSSLESVKPDTESGNGDPTDEEIQKLLDEENGTKDAGIWGNFIQLVKDNAITLTILIILVGVTIGVVVYRKRKAIDDDKSI